MIRIKALNHESDSESVTDDEVQVTKEAEETIAVTEYMRALAFKANGKNIDAMILFTELLETRVLNEISIGDKGEKLFNVRYNCHRNIALISEDAGNDDEALDHYMKAMQLDDTEVYIMFKLGQLALKKDKFELAELAFENCLLRNPNHWPSADGILQCLCKTANIMRAYGWALKWYQKDKNYERGEDVLLEITEKFSHCIPFFEKVFNDSFKPSKIASDVPKKPSVFPEPKIIIEEDQTMKKPNLDEFKQDTLNWLTVGKFILSVYKHLLETKTSILFLLSIEDIYQELANQEVEKIEIDIMDTNEQGGESTQNSNDSYRSVKIIESKIVDFIELDSQSDEGNFAAPATPPIEQQEFDEMSSTNENQQRKPRRRCSDLSFLEQWGWHKNRRYSARKKSQGAELDTSVKGFLRRIFPKLHEETHLNENEFNVNKSKEIKEKCNAESMTYENFQKLTENDFQKFLTELKSQNFDLILIIFIWLKYISKYWQKTLTDELKNIYLEIYEFYLNHWDLQTWNQLSDDDFNSSFRMGIYYLELDLERSIDKSKDDLPKQIDSNWKMIYHHLMFNSGVAFVISDAFYDINLIRLNWCNFVSTTKLELNLPKSVECLEHIESLVKDQCSNDTSENFELALPNLKENNLITIQVVQVTKENLKRRISLNKVRECYDNQEYKKIVDIIKESLLSGKNLTFSYDSPLSVQVQFEVLLESLWNLCEFEDCFVWSEKCFSYAVNQLILAPTDTFRYEEWADNCNFIMIYLEELFLKDSSELFGAIEKYLPRLVQNCVRILVHQLDAPFDKNNNPTHPVNIKRPWVILHQILIRREDSSPVQIKQTNKSDESLQLDENLELLPQALLLLFTAHEVLGRRLWCTRDHGQLLLYMLDIIIPKIRAPYMDAYRDLVIEHLEQATYCLYGYPPKKARSKHIEEHDAQQIDLTWKRAIQLFDLYRPEKLPEFNSFKLESISTDMEQLLLKILPLIPKDLDPKAHSANIQDYIDLKRNELPDEVKLLPQRISCIFYLLADFYFKNRDFQKTVKYYVLDLTSDPTRFDSWAGIALSKTSKLDTKLNSCLNTDYKDCLDESESALRCFQECIKLDKKQTLLWIEYGSFAYYMFAYCNRLSKSLKNKISTEQYSFIVERKEKYLEISYDAFIIADKTIKIQQQEIQTEDNIDNDSHDEKWLHHFMLGKIAEKKNNHPRNYLDHYLLASKLLYENGATYPIKINHNNPSTLSVESLEVFYRTSSAIIKYLEQNTEINREVGRLFQQVLKDLSSSPFAFNKAKIDDNSVNALKRKLAAEKAEAASKQIKVVNESSVLLVENDITDTSTTKIIKENIQAPKTSNENVESPQEIDFDENIAASPIPNPTVEKLKENSVKSRSQTPALLGGSKVNCPSRRGSQESSITTNSTTATSNTSSSSSSSGSSSSSSESESDSETESDEPDENTPFSLSELEPIYKQCVKNLEECVTRLPEHYKSIYRLVYHYLNGPEKFRNLEKCHQLLLGQYKTALGNNITGLFCERKNNNFFNGIWRIPSPEIDRPGSFSSHLVKCVRILLQVLRKMCDHKILIDMTLQLQRNPDNDKRYIKDLDRKVLYQQSINYYREIIRDNLTANKVKEKRNDQEILDLIIDVYKAHKKCIKHMNQKEALFNQLLIDVYKFYIEDKVARIPENINLLDLAIRLCSQEISRKKNQEKQTLTGTINPDGLRFETVPEKINIPGLSAFMAPKNVPGTSSFGIITTSSTSNTKRGRPFGSKNSTMPSVTMATPAINFSPQNYLSGLMDPTSVAALMAYYSQPNVGSTLPSPKDANYTNFISEYSKFNATTLPITSSSGNLTASSLLLQPNSKIKSSSKLPQFDMKSLIASATSKATAEKCSNLSLSGATTISMGSGQLTITPTISTMSKSSPITTTTSTASITLTKVPQAGSISVKPLSELTAKPSTKSSAELKNLPKSLTITPSSFYDGSNMNLPSDSGKIKTSKTKHSSMPYNVGVKPSTTITDPTSIRGSERYFGSSQKATSSKQPLPTSDIYAKALASLTSTSAFNLGNYNQQVSLLNTYAEMLKNSELGTNVDMFSQLNKFSSSMKPNQMPKKRSRNLTKPRFTPPPSLPPQTTMTPVPTPKMISPILPPPPSSSPFAAISRLTPSPQHHSIQISPSKTLQEKLAEKQKANQLNNKNSSSKPKKDLDVIILD